MPRRRQSPEAAVAAFFQEADPAVALALFRVVRGILDARGVLQAPSPTPVRSRRLQGDPPLPLDRIDEA